MSTRFPLFIPLVPLAAAGLLAAAPAAAQGTSEQRAACTGDAMRLCLSEVPNVGKITACMKSHYGELSSRCQATFNEGSQAAPPRKLAEEPAKPPVAKPPATQAETHPAAAPAAPERHEVAKAVPREAPRQRLAKAPVEKAPAEKVQVAKTPAPKVERTAAEPAERRARRHRDVEEAAPRALASRELPAREVPAAEPVEPDLSTAPPYPRVAGDVVAAPPRPATGLPAGNLAAACREGLIDPYTCGHTIPALGLGE